MFLGDVSQRLTDRKSWLSSLEKNAAFEITRELLLLI